MPAFYGDIREGDAQSSGLDVTCRHRVLAYSSCNHPNLTCNSRPLPSDTVHPRPISSHSLPFPMLILGSYPAYAPQVVSSQLSSSPLACCWLPPDLVPSLHIPSPFARSAASRSSPETSPRLRRPTHSLHPLPDHLVHLEKLGATPVDAHGFALEQVGLEVSV